MDKGGAFSKSEDLDELKTMHDLARDYQAKGKIQHAEKLYREVLEKREAIQGKFHPDTLSTMENLARLLTGPGEDYREGQRLYDEVEKRREEILDQDILGTLTAKYKLANGYKDEKDYIEAEALYKEVLEKQESILGKDHPDTLRTMHTVAMVYDNLGRYREAEELYKKVRIRKKEEVTFTLERRDSLKFAVQIEKENKEKRQSYGRGQIERKNSSESKHSDILTAMHTSAKTYVAQGKYIEAEELYKEVLERREKILEPGHPDILNTTYDLAGVYHAQEKYIEAEELYRELLEKQKAVLGKEHPDTLKTRNNLANHYKDKQEYLEAEQHYKELLKKQEAILRKGHPHILKTINNLGWIYRRQGKYEEAENLQKDHPDTLKTMSSYPDLTKLKKNIKKDRRRGIGVVMGLVIGALVGIMIEILVRIVIGVSIGASIVEQMNPEEGGEPGYVLYGICMVVSGCAVLGMLIGRMIAELGD